MKSWICYFSSFFTVETQVTHLILCELLQLLEDSLSSSKSERIYWGTPVNVLEIYGATDLLSMQVMSRYP